jgi:hypothetical protein
VSLYPRPLVTSLTCVLQNVPLRRITSNGILQPIVGEGDIFRANRQFIIIIMGVAVSSALGFAHYRRGLLAPAPLATNSLPDAGPKRCRIPDCTYNAYYDFSEQEQTEYCGQGHQL